MSVPPPLRGAGHEPHPLRPGRWRLVPAASLAGFRVRDKLVTTVHGAMPVLGGSLTVDDHGAVLRASVRVDPGGVSTGDFRRDRDLQKARFLGTAEHPVVEVFTTSTTARDGGGTAEAVVAARGNEAPVELVGTLEPPPAAVPHGVQLRVTGRLDRRPLAIGAPTVIIGRYLDLEAELVFEPEEDGGAGAASRPG